MKNPHEHAYLGYLLLKTFVPFADAAEIVRFHHVRWENGAGSRFLGKRVPMESHLIHLADRVAVLLKTETSLHGREEAISGRIMGQSGGMFVPEQVAAFLESAEQVYSRQDEISALFETGMRRVFDGKGPELDAKGLDGLSRLFCRIIDFRSHFTSTHTSGVAACAASLSGLAGFSETDRRKMTLAGFIHDLGKLAIPAEILEKTSALSREEYEIIRTHAYHSDQILKPIRAFDTVRKWGALHHERLDGSGYPYHLKARDLPTGSRIMSVADVFVALTEDRPYRKGMGREEVTRVLDRMVRRSALDPRIVFLLGTRFHEINMVRRSAQNRAAAEYRQFTGQAADIAGD